jgi:hypothetical protein
VGDLLLVADLGRYGWSALGPDGRARAVVGRFGAGPGRFRVPVGIGGDGEGRVWVADGRNAEVQEFRRANRAGTTYAFVRRFSAWRQHGTRQRLIQPRGLVVDPARNRVFVADTVHGLVAFSGSGRFKATWSPRRGYTPVGLAVGPGGSVFATFGAAGGAQNTWRLDPGLRHPRAIGLANPSGTPYLTVDGRGAFYVLEPPGTPGTVTKFTQESGGFQEDTFILPPPAFHLGLAVDAARRVFLPAFANSPRPRGGVRVYALRDPTSPFSPYRLKSIWRGG